MDSKRFLVPTSTDDLFVFKPSGEYRFLAHDHFSSKVKVKLARWAGTSSTEIVVRCGNVLKTLNVDTEQFKTLCPCPSGLDDLEYEYEVSNDMKTVVFFFCSSFRHSGAQGIWVWRAGNKAPTRVVPGKWLGGTISPDGAIVSATGTQYEKSGVFDTTTGKPVWENVVPRPYELAFDSAGKKVAFFGGSSDRSEFPTFYTMTTDDPTPKPAVRRDGRWGEMAKKSRVWNLKLSADGSEIFFVNTPQGDNRFRIRTIYI